MHSVELIWNKGLNFSVSQDGHTFEIDGSEEFGGKDLGPRPKALLLSALAGCSSMDIVSMLEKMKHTDFTFKIKVDAELNNEHPIVYTKAHITYLFEGEDLNSKNIIKAVSLSEDKYCGVSAILKKAFPITSEIILNGDKIK
ncbi:MAG: OsmC family protein [Candidatus Cloacimonetes bacterium]|jgi:putative redox protein|nr:OsmC family protein [Candidatus Cloacimonadota bacterium]MDD4155521.1 OsmC family protein [Candidatus Cloacimonadota bacterium]